ncbi:hypothetical protein AXK12_00990 [Cephaloticoccus capnophilus]|uniref:DUF560 domain-containing protein n=1 Tax=Cephaloticoccus capnophilus TaxID=1548208 RepID=A0A139STX3_9BACT|nr:outer membrane beta-barrel protein [Cephaloticoccus capnophilus]KXU37964.1 hypothetical protein AXK12_00990 [Cephaloticoccus capnophilus]
MMKITSSKLAVPVAALLGLFATTPGYSLVTFNDGQNSIFVNVSTGMSWDSNINSSADTTSDHIWFANVGVNFSRRAGIISIDANATANISRFNNHSEENFANPDMSLSLSKHTGRTTGTLSLSGARQNRADSAANIRNESWYYNAQGSLKYPIISRYSLTFGGGFHERTFRNAPGYLVDDRVTNWSTGLNYAYTDQTDLTASYRGRYGETSAHDSYYDHAFLVGVNGKILAKLTGSFHMGYQQRNNTKKWQGSHSSLTMSGSANWRISPKFNAAFFISKDFSVASTNIHTDTLSAGTNVSYSLTPRFSVNGGINGGESRFLGLGGGGRKDQFFGANVGASYAVYGDYLRLHLGYNYFRNWSNTAISDYDRDSLSLSASSRF